MCLLLLCGCCLWRCCVAVVFGVVVRFYSLHFSGYFCFFSLYELLCVLF